MVPASWILGSAGFFSIALIAITITALAAHFIVYLRYALVAVRYPFELFDAEGIVWQQAMLIPGVRMYGDINRFPFIVFHYPPVYHLVVRAVAALGMDPLVAGRSISVLASLLTAALAASLAFRATRNEAGRLASVAGAATAGLTFFCFVPVVACSPLMRVDMLAMALSFLGVWFAIRSVNRPRLLYIAMALFVVAVFTKQTSIAAPLATMAVMALVNPKRALMVCCFGLLLGSTALIILTGATDGGFLRHIILYNINRYSLELAAQYWITVVLPQLGFVLLAMVSITIYWKRTASERTWHDLASFRRDLASSDAVQVMAILTLYMGVSTCMLVTLGKSGAGLSYFVEWMGLLSVLIGTLVAAIMGHQLIKADPDSARSAIVFGPLLPMLLLMQVLLSPASRDFGFADLTQSQQLNQLVVRIRDASQPVLSDDMVLLMRAGKEVPWEPAIFMELASTGRWDERQIISLIASYYFAFVISHGHDNHFSPAVAHAIQTAYPRTEEHAEHMVHLPPALEK
jgi:Dolichyl-phosphate-mannose-protein mannosyltransferase